MLLFLVIQVQGFINIPLVNCSFDDPMDNQWNSSDCRYFAILSSNTTNQNLSLLVDTTSSWLMISASALSSAYSDSNCSTSISTSWAGNQVSGKLCSIIINTNENQVKSLKFLLTNLSFPSSDGVLGLASSRLSAGFLPPVDQLEESVFSLYFSSESYSVLTIGGYSDDYSQGDPIEFKSYPHSGTWRLPIESISFKSSIFPIYSYAILNTSSSKIALPSNIFNKITQEIDSILDCDIEDSVVCNIEGFNTTLLPNITLLLDENKILLQFFDFVKCYRNSCHLLIENDSEGRVVLGVPFFEKFYMVFDQNRFAVSLFESRKNLNSRVFNTIYIVGIVVLAVIISIPICFMCMLSKIKGVAEQSPGYLRIQEPLNN